MHDILIQGDTVVGGFGAPAARAEVVVRGGRTAAVGHQLGGAQRVIDARGLLVTPGFVDIHAHCDGQATWDALPTPSCWHAVTTAVFGNCGVGFAPVRPGSTGYLINLMEGVEDLAGTLLAEGIAWSWESFAQDLDAPDRRHYAMATGAQLPHGALGITTSPTVKHCARGYRPTFVSGMEVLRDVELSGQTPGRLARG